MRAIDTLTREHHWIRHLLDALERAVEHAIQYGHLPHGNVAGVLSYLEYFADGSHQEKEERALFPRLLHGASIEERLLIGRLFADHEGDRRMLRTLHAELLGATFGEPVRVREFVRHAAEYVRSHREHMAREQTVLFPLADRLLRPGEDEAVQVGFERIEREAHVQVDDPTIEELVTSLGTRWHPLASTGTEGAQTGSS